MRTKTHRKHFTKKKKKYDWFTRFFHAGTRTVILQVATVSVLVVFLVLSLLGLTRSTTTPNEKHASTNELPSGSEIAQAPPPADTRSADVHDPFQDLHLKAASVYVWDVRDRKVLFEKNATEKRPLASITKVMTAIIAKEELPDYALVPVEKEALKTDGDTGLQENEEWSLESILEVSLVSSSNDAAAAVASAAGSLLGRSENYNDNIESFVHAMNEKASEIGLLDTYFSNPHGLDINRFEAGSYGTALDTTLMVEYALRNHPEILEPTSQDSFTVHSLTNREQEIKNTNKIISQIPGLFASKTGYTKLAGGNLVVGFDAGLNHPVIAVVLGSTYSGRFDDMVQLVNATLDSFSSQQAIKMVER